MADLGTMTGGSQLHPGPRDDERPRRSVRRNRGLPGGRAVVGAFLVTAAAVGVFAAFLTATADPQTRYAVAARDVEIGTRLASDAEIAELFEFVALDLPPRIVARAVSDRQAPQLAGQLVVAPVSEGDLLLASAILDDARVPGTETLSFSLPAADAVDGALQPGERVDVLATHGSGTDAWTAFVVRGVLLVDTSAPGGGTSGSDEVVLTVAVSSLRDVQALGHATRTAEVFVTRSTVSEGATEAAPDAYSPARDDAGPTPRPADDPLGLGTAGDGAPAPGGWADSQDADPEG